MYEFRGSGGWVVITVYEVRLRGEGKTAVYEGADSGGETIV